MLPSMDDLRDFPQFSPLIAAVIAPISTLLDIPALTEPWFYRNDEDGKTLPDPRANIILSSFGLSFNIIANGLLILRFSTRDGLWRFATRASLLCWITKVPQLYARFGSLLMSLRIAWNRYRECNSVWCSLS